VLIQINYKIFRFFTGFLFVVTSNVKTEIPEITTKIREYWAIENIFSYEFIKKLEKSIPNEAAARSANARHWLAIKSLKRDANTANIPKTAIFADNGFLKILLNFRHSFFKLSPPITLQKNLSK